MEKGGGGIRKKQIIERAQKLAEPTRNMKCMEKGGGGIQISKKLNLMEKGGGGVARGPSV